MGTKKSREKAAAKTVRGPTRENVPSEADRSVSNKNSGLTAARTGKNDEFYTQLTDVEKELRHHKNNLRGKVVLCNCDDPFESNFFKYFAINFNDLGLKKLIATSYLRSPITGRQLALLDIEGLKPEGKEPYAIEINCVPDHDGKGATDLSDVEYLLRHHANTARTLVGDEEFEAGDFRSKECLDFLKEADVVATNPPFSLFREFVQTLVKHKKKFIIIGNVNAATCKGIFELIRDNKLWLGESIHSGDREFRVPDHYPMQAAGFRIDDAGTKYIRVKGVRWFTNMHVPTRGAQIPLYEKYSRSKNPTFDNYNVIEVGKVAEIPDGYKGAMAVPITFLDRYNPNQFQILDSNDYRKDPKKTPFKAHGLIKDKDGTINGKAKYVRIVIRKLP